MCWIDAVANFPDVQTFGAEIGVQFEPFKRQHRSGNEHLTQTM
jgi:hypothetical protein